MQLIFKDNNIRTTEFNGDTYINTLDCCRLFNGKRATHYFRTQRATEFVNRMEAAHKQSDKVYSALVVTNNGGDKRIQGTWINISSQYGRQIFYSFAQWIDIEFHIWCTEQIDTIIMKKQQDNTNVLPPEVGYKGSNNPGLMAARDYAEISDLMADNPKLAQIMIDNTINYYNLVPQQKALPSSGDLLYGTTEIALQLGYKVNHSNRSKLGKYIIACGHEPVKEKRLVNGIAMPVNCYKLTEQLKSDVKAFFDN